MLKFITIDEAMKQTKMLNSVIKKFLNLEKVIQEQYSDTSFTTESQKQKENEHKSVILEKSQKKTRWIFEFKITFYFPLQASQIISVYFRVNKLINF